MDNVLNGANASIGRLPATKVLSTLGDHLLDDLDGGHGLFLEAVVAARRDPELAARLRERVADEGRRLGKIVDEGTSDGLLDPDLDQQAVVRLAHAIGFGMLLTRSMGLDLPDPDHWHVVISRVLDGLALPPASMPDTTPSGEQR